MNNEPTYRQHKLLEKISAIGVAIQTNEKENLDLHWQMVRFGYLKSLLATKDNSCWKFELTDKAMEYLNSIEPEKKVKEKPQIVKVKIFVTGARGNWRAVFKIGVQSFHVCERSTKAEALWYCKCLRAAFKNLEN